MDFGRTRLLSTSLGFHDQRDSMYKTHAGSRALRSKLVARIALFAFIVFLVGEGFTAHFFPTEDFMNGGVEDFPGLNSMPNALQPTSSSRWRKRPQSRMEEKAGPTKLVSATVREQTIHQETVIFLPGLAQPAKGQPISDQLGARFPTVRWVSFQAPTRPVSVVNGSELAWFDMHAFPFVTGDDDSAQIYESARLLTAVVEAERSELIRTLRRRGGLEALPKGQRVRILRGSNTHEVGDGEIGTQAEREWATSRIALAGFSQGAAMALFAGLTIKDRVAGVVVLSGLLPLQSEIADLVRDKNRFNLPVFWAHGIDDPILLIADATSSVAQLQATEHAAGKPSGLGLTDVEFHAYPNLGHAWFPLEYQQVGDFLARVFQSHRGKARSMR